MLTQQAIDKFIQRPRDDHRHFKELTPQQVDDMRRQLPGRLPLWATLRHDQRICVLLGVKLRRLALFADTGCVAAETELETEQGSVRIDELEQRGKPIRIYSLTPDGIQLVWATCPFKRGPTALYTVTFTSGRRIIVTARHRFLTARGWLSCDELQPGERLPVFDACHHQSTSGTCLFPSLPPCDSVASVTYLRTTVYYDLHVPIHENYLAHGLIHHNTGKTLMALAIFRYLQSTRVTKRVLVLVPRLAIKDEWERELTKHTPDLKYLILRGSSDVKWELLRQSQAPVVVETYAGLTRMCSDLAPRRRKGRNKLQPSRVKVMEIGKQFGGLILDECHAIKNHQSLAYRISRKLADAMPMVLALTATPFGRDPGDLWAQLRVVDKGYSLGESLGLFRATFFTYHTNFWGDLEWTFKKKLTQMLHRMLAHSSLRYAADETTLPRVVPIIKSAHLPMDANTYYQRARQAIKDAKGNKREIGNAFLRMRQISSGFVGYHDDDLGESAQFEFPTNPKLDLLLGIVESLAHKCIVFHDFIWSGQRISRELKLLKIGHVMLNGQSKDVATARARFENDAECRVLVLSNALALGLNLQAARYGIFYEAPVPVLMRTQSCRRFERQYSPHRVVFRYDLVTKGTVDELILAFHRQGRDLLRAIVDGEVSP